MIEIPTTMFDAEFMAEFWGNVKWFASYNMPIFMLCMAVLLAGLVIDMIGDVVQSAKDANDDDDDYDVKHY